MKKVDRFSDDDWEPCTCPLGIVVGGQYADVPPTTGPEHCSCEAHRDDWARAQRQPNRASRGIEQARAERVAQETLDDISPVIGFSARRVTEYGP